MLLSEWRTEIDANLKVVVVVVFVYLFIYFLFIYYFFLFIFFLSKRWPLITRFKLVSTRSVEQVKVDGEKYATIHSPFLSV